MLERELADSEHTHQLRSAHLGMPSEHTLEMCFSIYVTSRLSLHALFGYDCIQSWISPDGHHQAVAMCFACANKMDWQMLRLSVMSVGTKLLRC